MCNSHATSIYHTVLSNMQYLIHARSTAFWTCCNNTEVTFSCNAGKHKFSTISNLSSNKSFWAIRCVTSEQAIAYTSFSCLQAYFNITSGTEYIMRSNQCIGLRQFMEHKVKFSKHSLPAGFGFIFSLNNIFTFINQVGPNQSTTSTRLTWMCQTCSCINQGIGNIITIITIIKIDSSTSISFTKIGVTKNAISSYSTLNINI